MINGVLRVLVLAADSRKAVPEKGARYSSTNILTLRLRKGWQHGTNNEEDCRDGKSGEVGPAAA
jgi:hypothetical protein